MGLVLSKVGAPRAKRTKKRKQIAAKKSTRKTKGQKKAKKLRAVKSLSKHRPLAAFSITKQLD